jgi:transposase
MRGPKAVEVRLSDEERVTLWAWAGRRKTAQALAARSRIVLACAEGKSNTRVAEELGVGRPMVTKWRNRFAVLRLQGLLDEPRPGRPRLVTDEKVEEVITKTLEERPADATHWSTRSMAKAAGMSQTSISRIWRAFGLQPHREDTFKLSTDPQFIDKLRDVVGLYLDPPQAAVVFCVDEKSQIQAIDRTQPAFPILPGTPARRSHDYIRHGTTSLFAALEVATGKVIGQTHGRHRNEEFRRFLNVIDREVPEHLDVHLILDNYSTHKTDEVQRWQLRHPRFYFHFIPTHASWLNLVERWFAELTNKWLRRSAHRSVAELRAAIEQWLAAWNENPRRFVWTKTADQILGTIASYCQRINDSGH